MSVATGADLTVEVSCNELVIDNWVCLLLLAHNMITFAPVSTTISLLASGSVWLDVTFCFYCRSIHPVKFD